MIGFDMSKRRKLGQLSWRQRRQLLQAAVLLPMIALGVRCIGLQRTYKILSALPRGRRSPREDHVALVRAHSTARMVRGAARHGAYHPSCLPQALTLWWLLHRQGIQAQLRIGVCKENGRLLGHAWIEYQLQVIGDDGDIRERFAPFDSVTDRLSAVAF
jgi:hypothetical protein